MRAALMGSVSHAALIVASAEVRLFSSAFRGKRQPVDLGARMAAAYHFDRTAGPPPVRPVPLTTSTVSEPMALDHGIVIEGEVVGRAEA